MEARVGTKEGVEARAVCRLGGTAAKGGRLRLVGGSS